MYRNFHKFQVEKKSITFLLRPRLLLKRLRSNNKSGAAEAVNVTRSAMEIEKRKKDLIDLRWGSIGSMLIILNSGPS